eukprot:CAMPEP_0204876192 /NCGR_PEP_ID=MMETSP1348-20121228/47497_1 /ASSEMBLY_ACC=CAM_ASM_000700 /TAXON_ID=215587 /ORGANISM="Aplanochytrium stocchinoi, Strain GSBS06" /LENGTH=383 /DNA_ID=CAMNT_0052032917 /DNA_START=359 /DNA_END=1510 /DNA_ORIENTATION=+
MTQRMASRNAGKKKPKKILKIPKIGKKLVKNAFARACEFYDKRKLLISNEDRLVLYALYKQATVGDNKITKPQYNQLSELQRHLAWKARSGISKKRAMELYIKNIQKLYPDFQADMPKASLVPTIERKLPEFDTRPGTTSMNVKDMQHILSRNTLTDTSDRKGAVMSQAADSSFDRRSYQSTITEDEYKRFTMVKIRKADSLGSIRSGLHLSARLPDSNPHKPYGGVQEIIDTIAASVTYANVSEEEAVNNEFAGTKQPKISLKDYLFRLVRYLDKWFYDTPGVKGVGFRSVLMTLVYLNRVKKEKSFQVTHYNVHRLWAVCMLLGAKFSEDYIIANNYWAEVAGISINELNELESRFCTYMSFNLYVSEDEIYEQYLKHAEI